MSDSATTGWSLKSAGFQVRALVVLVVPSGLTTVYGGLLLDYPPFAAQKISWGVALALLLWCVYAVVCIAANRVHAGNAAVKAYLVVGTTFVLLLAIQLIAALWLPHIGGSYDVPESFAQAVQLSRFLLITRSLAYAVSLLAFWIMCSATFFEPGTRLLGRSLARMSDMHLPWMLRVLEVVLAVCTALLLLKSDASVFSNDATLKVFRTVPRDFSPFTLQYVALGTCLIMFVLLHVTPVLVKLQIWILRGKLASPDEVEQARQSPV